jgi:Mrp family chromosome partitioning ATPase
MNRPFAKKGLPETELEFAIAAQNDAAAEAKRLALNVERQRLYEAREAAIKAGRHVEVQRVAVPTPAQRTAIAIRASQGDAWPEFVTWLRAAGAAELKVALLAIEADEEGRRRHAAVAQIGADRRAAEAAEDAAREARRFSVTGAAA